jgi:exodeoxyribonuclease VII small subunit
MTTTAKATPRAKTASAVANDSPRLSYEDARAQLEQVVKELEQQNVPLEQSMQLWQRGEELAQICEEWLSGARKKLTDAMAARKQDGS